MSTPRSGVTLNGRIVFGLMVMTAFVAVALLAPWLAPHDPLAQDLIFGGLPPSWHADGDAQFLFGTDTLGRDILSRLIHGAQPALIVAVFGALFAAIIGVALGLLAGYYGGWIDQLVSRTVDIWMAFPAVLLAIVLVAIVGAGLGSVILAIAIIDWTRFCRVVRAETRLQSQLDYVISARTLGMSRLQILWREILPNVAPLILTLFTLQMGIAVVVEAILSFVGLSVATDMPTWGGLIRDGRLYVNQTPWLLGLPVLAITITVLGLNALGDGLREALDPASAK